MSISTVTVQLPEGVYHRLQAMAQVTHQPVETVMLQAIEGNLPPMIEDIPIEWQTDLALLQSVDDTILWQIIHETLPAESWSCHQALLEKNQGDSLTAEEQQELSQYREVVERFVFRRSYALALLKWRGYTLPLSESYGPT